jgi:NAD(P)H-hydrate epimerase
MRLPTQLLRRRPRAHKGDFGHVFILAGSARYSGAAVLCSLSALRAGSGLVTVGLPKGLNDAFNRIKPYEVMTLPLADTVEGTLHLLAYKKIENFLKGVDVVVVGPGLGRHPLTDSLIRKVVQCESSMVIDADGLNALAGHSALLRGNRLKPPIRIITPHPGEMARLTGKTVQEIQKKRRAVAQDFAVTYTVTVVLKGYQTVVADYQQGVYVNKTGNPGMATAGSGDVLTGIIAAFLGQGLKPFDAARYGVYVHGLAGDLAAQEKTEISLIASDIIDKIPQAFKRSS